jgi:hypothetical protein
MRLLITTCFLFALTSAAFSVECKTAAQREDYVHTLNNKIDWFLSIVEDVPGGVARQFRDVDILDERAVRSAFNHPLFLAHNVREAAAKLKDSLASAMRYSGPSRVKYAIWAVRDTGLLNEELNDYGKANSGRRIVDFRKWGFERATLLGEVTMFATCLADFPQ